VSRAIEACRACGNPRLQPILDLGEMAYTGIFPRPGQAVPRGRLELVRCAGDGPDVCGLVQLRHSFPPCDLYGSNYGYRSGLNAGMVAHLRGVVERVKAAVELRPGDLVLDIGSNDGTTLRHYDRTDLELVGIDPSGGKFAHYYPSHVRLIPDFFSAAAVRAKASNSAAKVVTSIAMFYDLEAPLEFMREVRDLLAPDGVWVFEQSYLPAMLDTTSYDTVCHEHLEYYGLRQVAWMAARAGLRVLDVAFNDVNGGSFQVLASRTESPYPAQESKIARALAEEERRQLRTPAPYAEFRRRVEAHRDDLSRTLDALRRKGRRVFGYGASTKGNVVLQYCGLGPADVAAIAEVNEDKFGCVTPGSAIPIVSERQARDQAPDVFLVLPWHFRKGIVQREQGYLAQGGTLLFPLPRIEAVARPAAGQAA